MSSPTPAPKQNESNKGQSNKNHDNPATPSDKPMDGNNPKTKPEVAHKPAPESKPKS